MSIWKRLFGGGAKPTKKPKEINGITNNTDKSIPVVKSDSYIESCFENKFKELDDNRWFSHFDELPEIDRLKNNGDLKAALKFCRDGLKKYPDSFLFYNRAADLYDELNQPEQAESILKEGLSKSLSKCSIAKNLAERAFKRNDYREAILWWIRSGLMQIESGIVVEFLPFLNLAYLCQPLQLKKEEQWYLSLADRASSQGPIRFDAEGTSLMHALIQKAVKDKDNEVIDVIKEFYKQYSNKLK